MWNVPRMNLSNAMLMDVYGWAPDGFTLFETADAGKFELVAILAFKNAGMDCVSRLAASQ